MVDQKTVQKTVSMTVKEKAMAAEGWKIIADIPALSSKYPTPLTRVSEQEANLMVPGKAYNIVLVRGRVKKEGTTPTHDYDWYWNWGGFAPNDFVPPASPKTSIGTASRDARSESIERQVALKQAQLAAEWLLRIPSPNREDRIPETEEVAEVFLEWIGRFYNAFVSLLQQVPEPVASESATVPQQADAVEVGGSPLSRFFEYAKLHKGYTTKEGVLTGLGGLKDEAEIFTKYKDLKAAYKALPEADSPPLEA